MRRLAVVLTALGLALAACDDGPGVPDPFAPPPTLSAFAFTPLQFALDTDAPTAEIPLSMSVQVSNPGGGALEVRYFVRPEFGTETLAEGVLSPAGGGRCAASTTLSIPRGETGVFVVTVTVASADGRVGNLVTGLLEFTAESLGPPVIEEPVEYPSTVAIPAAGEDPTLFQIVARVTDPDGQQNISRVVVRPEGGTEREMLDDGGFDEKGEPTNSGDETANDGRYTITFQVPSGSPAGPLDFTIRATDRSGQQSEPVTITITFE